MADIYFSPTGNDTTGDGSSGNPYETLSKAFTEASDGDTLYAMDGTHTFVSQSFSGKNVYLKGQNKPVYDTTQTYNYRGAVFDAGGSNTAALTNIGNLYELSDIIFANHGDGTTSNVSGILFNNDSGISTIIQRCVFTQNYIHTTSGNGTFLLAIQAEDTIISSCIFANNYTKSGANYTGIFRRPNTGNICYAYNNVFYFNGPTYEIGYAVYTPGAGAGSMASKNNIFVGGNCVSMDVGTSGLFDYNCAYDCTNVPSGTGNITDDPLFIDAGNDDFRLQLTSPCRGAGGLI